MSDYSIRFIGHMDEMKRPDGFPKEIHFDMFARVNNEEDLREAINEYAKTLIKQQCMIVPADHSEIEDKTKMKFDSKIMVPMSSLVYISTQTKRIDGEIPGVGLAGELQLSDGSKVSLQ